MSRTINRSVPQIAAHLSWLDHAACADLPLSVFFSNKPLVRAKAKAICDGCPVKAECATYTEGLANLSRGVFAGRQVG